MFRMIIALSLLTLSRISIAEADQVRDVNITNLMTYHDFAIVYFSPSFENTQGCEKTEKFKAIIRYQDGANQEMYASVLAAGMTGKAVGLGINGCDVQGYPQVYRVDVKF